MDGSGGDPEDTACEGRSAGGQYLKGKRASPACELADEESSDDTDVNNDGKEQGRSKRQRLQWNEELIKRFENAVNHLVSKVSSLGGGSSPACGLFPSFGEEEGLCVWNFGDNAL